MTNYRITMRSNCFMSQQNKSATVFILTFKSGDLDKTPFKFFIIVCAMKTCAMNGKVVQQWKFSKSLWAHDLKGVKQTLADYVSISCMIVLLWQILYVFLNHNPHHHHWGQKMAVTLLNDTVSGSNGIQTTYQNFAERSQPLQ